MSNPVQWLSCGFEHCAVVTVEGEVFTWGYGGSGALGHGNTLSYATPTRVQALAGQGIAYLECGGYHNAAFNTAGKLWVWGRGDVNQLGVSFKKLIHDELGYLALSPLELEEFSRWRRSVHGVACGEAHTLVLDSAGSVYAFGWAEDGQLGLPDTAISEGMMTTKIERIDGIPKAVKVTAGSLFSAILTETGNVYSWGNGEQGQLGQGSKVLRRPRPFQLTSISAETIVDLVCGENYALAVSQEGKVFGWGQGIAGAFEGGQFTKGSELVCYVPRELAEVDVAQHLAVFRTKRRVSAEQPSFLWALEEELRRLEQDD
jgi:alpha-tubulin suppressor-like RCC1 family protein